MLSQIWWPDWSGPYEKQQQQQQTIYGMQSNDMNGPCNGSTNANHAEESGVFALSPNYSAASWRVRMMGSVVVYSIQAQCDTNLHVLF